MVLEHLIETYDPTVKWGVSVLCSGGITHVEHGLIEEIDMLLERDSRSGIGSDRYRSEVFEDKLIESCHSIADMVTENSTRDSSKSIDR